MSCSGVQRVLSYGTIDFYCKLLFTATQKLPRFTASTAVFYDVKHHKQPQLTARIRVEFIANPIPTCLK